MTAVTLTVTVILAGHGKNLCFYYTGRVTGQLIS